MSKKDPTITFTKKELQYFIQQEIINKLKIHESEVDGKTGIFLSWEIVDEKTDFWKEKRIDNTLSKY